MISAFGRPRKAALGSVLHQEMAGNDVMSLCGLSKPLPVLVPPARVHGRWVFLLMSVVGVGDCWSVVVGSAVHD